jgi:hypothetical protein
MQSSTYRLELTIDGDASSQTEIVVSSVAEVRAFVAQSLVPNSILIVTHLKHDADYGNFVIFLNAIGLAYVRVLEHRGFHATRLDATATGRTVQFVDDGGKFDVDENSTIPCATAVEALNHWLATGERFSDVCWIDE